MKKISIVATIILILINAGQVFGEEHSDITKHTSCIYCGMDRAKFAHSRMLLEYDDGSALGTCSVHCAAVDLALFIDKIPSFYGVGDYGTKKLIDAEKAFWVLGGDKPGVMTKNAKWAFKLKEDADQFIQVHGGRLVDFETILKAAYADMYQDTKMIRMKRKMKREKMMKNAK